MPLQWIIVFFPWAGRPGAGGHPGPAARGGGECRGERGTFGLAVALAMMPFADHGWTRTDALNIPFVLVSAFIGLTTSVFSAATLDQEGFDHWRIRAYHAAYQIFMGAQTLALLADNLGVMWVAVEIATLATVSMVGGAPHARGLRGGVEVLHPVRRGHRARAVRHHRAVPGGAAAADRGDGAVLGGADGRRGALRSGHAEPRLRLPAAGLWHQGGLVPLHSWLPDAHAEGPVPISAVLSGLLLNAAMLAVLRANRSSAPTPMRSRRDPSCWRWAWRRCCSPPCRCGGGAMRGASSAGRASSTWAWPPSPSASGVRRRTSRGCCTCWAIRW